MNFKSLLVAGLGLMALAFSARADEPTPNCTVVVDKNGVETEFYGTTLEFFTDANGRRMAHTDIRFELEEYKLDAEWPVEDLKQIKIEYRDFDAGIVNPIVPANGAELNYANGLITVKGAKEGDTLRIYSMSGILIASHKLTDEVRAFSLSSLPAGVYIAHIAGVTVKISKK